MSAPFVHMGPLKPIEITQQEWYAHPLLSSARIEPNGTVTWLFAKASFEVERARDSELKKVKFVQGDSGVWMARIPPRLNHDWFVENCGDEDDRAPVLGRARDITRFYELTWEGAIDFGLMCAETIDDVRRYFELMSGIWVNVPRHRWITIRNTEGPRELGWKAMEEKYPHEYSAPRFERSSGDPLMTDVDALVQCARAEAIASLVHRGHVDKLGERYINHAARVASRFDVVDEPIEHAAAWLLDVIEDGNVAAQELLEAGLLPEIVEVVAVLTRPGFPWEDKDYYERVRGNPWALSVKLADIDDNTAEWRTRLLDEKTRTRLAEKYRNARAQLEKRVEGE